MSKNHELKYYNQENVWERYKDAKELDRANKLVSLIPKDANSVIDIGCGNGIIINLIERPFVVGLDFARIPLSQVKTNKIQASIDNLPIKSNEFDIVILTEILEHLDEESYIEATKEITRLNAKYLLISIPFNENFNVGLCKCSVCGNLFDSCHHRRRFTDSWFKAVFPEYKAIKIEYGSFITPASAILIWLKHKFNIYTYSDTAVCDKCGNPACRKPNTLIRYILGALNLFNATIKRILKIQKPYHMAVLLERIIEASSIHKYFIEHPFEEMFPGSRRCNFTTDDNQVILANYVNPPLGEQYNPVVISLYALSQYSKFVATTETQYKGAFLNQANWLVHNLDENEEFGVWNYNFDWNIYECKAPWVSAMAQGLGISVLLRAWKVTSNERYLEVARKALASFEVPISEGGVVYIDGKGDTWYEEYPCPKRTQVLNGFIFALIGVYEFYEYTKSVKARYIFDKGVQTLKNRLKDFNLNLVLFKWSRYDNKYGIYSGKMYHDVHIKQMEKLYEITGEQIFDHYRGKWGTYKKEYAKPYRVIRVTGIIIFRLYVKILMIALPHLRRGVKE